MTARRVVIAVSVCSLTGGLLAWTGYEWWSDRACRPSGNFDFAVPYDGASTPRAALDDFLGSGLAEHAPDDGWRPVRYGGEVSLRSGDWTFVLFHRRDSGWIVSDVECW